MANRNEYVERIAAWIGNPAEYAEAEQAVAALGEAAIPGVCEYLDQGPQAIPQLRCFAVAMLARLHAPAATAALRRLLHEHPLHDLAPPYMDSEYVVKCAALEALAGRAYPARADDIAFGLHERLRTAVVAAGQSGLLQFADALVGMLDDDVLAEDAMIALIAMGPDASGALAPRLDAWLIEARDNARRRLALIRALRVLHRLQTSAGATGRRALRDAHPAVCAAAALLLWREQHDVAMIEAVLHGAIGFDRELADDCRTLLAEAGPELGPAAERALKRNTEPDLYGQLHPLSSEPRHWLTKLLQHAGQH